MYFSWPGALTAILLGLAPSAWDVSSDYVYAQTWDETEYNPQIRALVYFFICLPHLMAVLNAVNSWIINLLDVPSASTPWRHIGTSALCRDTPLAWPPLSDSLRCFYSWDYTILTS